MRNNFKESDSSESQEKRENSQVKEIPKGDVHFSPDGRIFIALEELSPRPSKVRG